MSQIKILPRGTLGVNDQKATIIQWQSDAPHPEISSALQQNVYCYGIPTLWLLHKANKILCGRPYDILGRRFDSKLMEGMNEISIHSPAHHSLPGPNDWARLYNPCYDRAL